MTEDEIKDAEKQVIAYMVKMERPVRWQEILVGVSRDISYEACKYAMEHLLDEGTVREAVGGGVRYELNPLYRLANL